MSHFLAFILDRSGSCPDLGIQSGFPKISTKIDPQYESGKAYLLKRFFSFMSVES